MTILQNYSVKTVHEILYIDENQEVSRGVIELLRQAPKLRLLYQTTLTEGLLALSENQSLTAVFLAAPEPELMRYVTHFRERFPNTNLIVLTQEQSTASDEALEPYVQDCIHVSDFDAQTFQRVLRFAQERNRLIRQLDEGRHELRTPITAIHGLSELLLETEEDPRRRTWLRSIRESSDLLLAVSKTLRADAKTTEPAPTQSFDLHETVENLIEIMRTNMEEQTVELQYHIMDEVPRQVMGEPVFLKQILINVLGNAIKFTAEGRVRLLVDEAAAKSEDDRLWLRFIITDTGVGIPEEIQEMIFQTYHRADEDIPGNGLGLAIVRRLVEEQGGTIRVRSKLGIGSTFDIHLPFDLHTPFLEKKSLLSSEKSNPIDLLLVENHAISQLVTRHILEKEFPEVRITTTSEESEALKFLQKQSFHLVLLDSPGPAWDGHELIEHLRQADDPARKNLPVLAMIAPNDVSDQTAWAKMGFTDYILKPFEPDELVQKIARYVKTESMTPNVYAHIDLSYLDLMADGDVQLRRLMLQLLTRELPTDFEKYQSLYEKRDWKELHRISHKMKTTLSFVGNATLTQHNAHIERIVKTRTDLGKLPDLLEQIQQIYPKVLDEIKDELAETKTI